MIDPKLRHSLSKMSWKIDGVMPNVGMVRYFTVFYCPDCLIGRLGDMTYDKPVGPSVKELGIKRRDVYPDECPVKVTKKAKRMIRKRELVTTDFASILGVRR